MPITHYIWDEVNDTLLMEKDEAGTTIAEYTHEPGQYGPLISQRRGGQTGFHHFDGQGSTRALTDESGTVTDTYTYTAFGETVASTGTTTNPFGYKGALGYYVNPETNDHYVRARTYEGSLARWLSPDPFPAILRACCYSYARNNPVMRVDPSGLLCQIQLPPVDCDAEKTNLLEHRLKRYIEEMQKREPPCAAPQIKCCPMKRPPRPNFDDPCTVCYRQKPTDRIVYGLFDGRTKQIVICPNNARDQGHLVRTMLEEIQHYFDVCTGEGKPFGDFCKDKACTELRGKTFAGECDDASQREPGESREGCLVRRVAASLRSILKCQDRAEEYAKTVLIDPKCRQLKPITGPDGRGSW